MIQLDSVPLSKQQDSAGNLQPKVPEPYFSEMKCLWPLGTAGRTRLRLVSRKNRKRTGIFFICFFFSFPFTCVECLRGNVNKELMLMSPWLFLL